MHDDITDMYYLRARYYAPYTRRFTQADTYHGDGLNLYVYAGNNPVKYVDPSGHDKINGNTNNILGKPLSEWTNEELQRAVDSVHSYVYGNEGKYKGRGGANPFSLIVSEDGTVVLASNNQYPSGAKDMMDKIFGPKNYYLVNGTRRTNYKIPSDTTLREGAFLNHAEARAIQGLRDKGGVVKGARHDCSNLSCESCTEIMQIEGVINITGSVSPDTVDKRNRYKRDYLERLWT